LLLFSNDGRLTSALLAPKRAVAREYEIVVRGDVGQEGSKRRKEIEGSVSKGVKTDYGVFEGNIVWMRRCDKKEEWEHQACGNDSGGNRNDKFDYGEGSGGGGKEGEEENEGETGEERIVGEEGAVDKAKEEAYSRIAVVVGEGKNRMVRRMFAALSLHVVNLKRIWYGNVRLDEGVEVGRWRYLNEEEECFCRGIIEEFIKDGKEWL